MVMDTPLNETTKAHALARLTAEMMIGVTPVETDAIAILDALVADGNACVTIEHGYRFYTLSDGENTPTVTSTEVQGG
jgi:hypothetical protein